ncbi:MAG: hypothetical protein EOO52_13705 [Gammaproteobacteria bacterium]|nr:MAG: hypothetical protein EOO52_13705 [Gammaproteobacteria bacterium]
MNNQPRIKAKAFGQKFALTLEACSELNKRENSLEHAVVIELAKANDDNTFDWLNKLNFKLLSHEMPLLAGVFLGFLPDYKIIRPANKSIEFVRQLGATNGKPGTYYVKAFESGQLYSLPLLPGHGAKMAMIVLHQLAKNDEGTFDDAFVIAAVRSACKLHYDRSPDS